MDRWLSAMMARISRCEGPVPLYVQSGDLVVAKVTELWDAEGNRRIVKRFGRFRHCNPILGRAMTPTEQAYLDEGGFAG